MECAEIRVSMFEFKIDVNDWNSIDGLEGSGYWFVCNVTYLEVSRAYVVAKAKVGVCIEQLCVWYREHGRSHDFTAELCALRDLGAPIPDVDEELTCMDIMSLMVWYIRRGDPNIELRRIGDPPKEKYTHKWVKDTIGFWKLVPREPRFARC